MLTIGYYPIILTKISLNKFLVGLGWISTPQDLLKNKVHLLTEKDKNSSKLLDIIRFGLIKGEKWTQQNYLTSWGTKIAGRLFSFLQTALAMSVRSLAGWE
jgi:hypothetical protein